MMNTAMQGVDVPKPGTKRFQPTTTPASPWEPHSGNKHAKHHPQPAKTDQTKKRNSTNKNKSTKEKKIKVVELKKTEKFRSISPDGRQNKIKHNLEEQQKLAHSRIHQLVNYLTRKTHFDSDQVRALIDMYRRIAALGTVDRLRFREMLSNMLGITDNVMLDRSFAAFDGDNEGSVSESEWVLGLSVMLKGTLEEQIRYCYQVYDVNADQSIGREELHSCLRGCLYTIPGQDMDFDLEEGVREMVELAMRKLDVDRDGQIKFHDFHEAVNSDPLLLQAVGECLPTDKAMMTFLSLIDTNTRKYSDYLSHPSDPSWERESNKFDLDAIERNKKHFKTTSENKMVLKSVFRKSVDDSHEDHFKLRATHHSFGSVGAKGSIFNTFGKNFGQDSGYQRWISRPGPHPSVVGII